MGTSCASAHIGLARADDLSVKVTQLLRRRCLRASLRRDFNSFVRACEKYGRENVAQIAAEVDGKTEEEVRAYAQVRGLRAA